MAISGLTAVKAWRLDVTEIRCSNIGVDPRAEVESPCASPGPTSRVAGAPAPPAAILKYLHRLCKTETGFNPLHRQRHRDRDREREPERERW